MDAGLGSGSVLRPGPASGLKGTGLTHGGVKGVMGGVAWAKSSSWVGKRAAS